MMEEQMMEAQENLRPEKNSKVPMVKVGAQCMTAAMTGRTAAKAPQQHLRMKARSKEATGD